MTRIANDAHPCDHSAMDDDISSLATTLQQPPVWLLPYVSVASQVLRSADSQSIANALNSARSGDGSSISFVEQAALPSDEAYESFVFRTGCVPTRNNLHDLFNGLVWLLYPRTKRRLNELQAREIARRGTAGTRGPLRDALTLFDENAAVLQAPPSLINALRQRDWHTLFIEERAQWNEARLALFGHALMEKLLRPRKAITAHVWVVDELDDACLAASLTVEKLAAKSFLPLPVLGVPGWCSENEDPRFYGDASVFRPSGAAPGDS